jgi:hypothetical protein
VALYDHRGRPDPKAAAQPRRPWVPVPPRRRVRKLASIVGFASKEFFHFVLEALPRLALLLPRLRAEPALHLAVPLTSEQLKASGPPRGFAMQLLRLLLPPEMFRRGRVIPYADEGVLPGERLVASESLVLAEWASASSADGSPTHCLTPRHALLVARDALNKALDEAGGEAAGEAAGRAAGEAAGEGAGEAKGEGSGDALVSARPAIVYAARRNVTMRNLVAADEEAVLASLSALASAHDLELVAFDGTQKDIQATIRLFRRAQVVVGVHGGALSNILFCTPAADGATPGTLLVELGTLSPLLRHFEHAAVALGHAYDRVLLSEDERGVGARDVSLPSGGAAQVERVVDEWLKGRGERREEMRRVHVEVSGAQQS